MLNSLIVYVPLLSTILKKVSLCHEHNRIVEPVQSNSTAVDDNGAMQTCVNLKMFAKRSYCQDHPKKPPQSLDSQSNPRRTLSWCKGCGSFCRNKWINERNVLFKFNPDATYSTQDPKKHSGPLFFLELWYTQWERYLCEARAKNGFIMATDWVFSALFIQIYKEGYKPMLS